MGTGWGPKYILMAKSLPLLLLCVNPFMPNGISHLYQLDESISKLRVVGL